MFKITFVCTGNRCRSAIAAELMRGLTLGLPVGVDSCGTLEAEGLPSPAETIEAARLLDLDLSAHRSRHLSGCDLSSADLVLGFELAHVAAAVIEGRAASERAFTLPEFVRLSRGLSQGIDPTRMVAAADQARRADPGYVPGEEIRDPIGRPVAEHRKVAAEIARLCEVVARSLGLSCSTKKP